MIKSMSINRRVQIWQYYVSHGKLLLVANPTNESKVRIAFIFRATDHINLPTYFDCERLEWDDTKEKKEYRFYTDKKNYHSVTALVMCVGEDELGFHEPIPIWEEETRVLTEEELQEALKERLKKKN